MSSLTSLQKRGGLEHSKSSDNPKNPSTLIWRLIATGLPVTAICLMGLLLFFFSPVAARDAAATAPSKSAAAACSSKLDKLEGFAKKHKPGQTQVTKFSEIEVNSYLALNLSKQYHPSLRSLEIKFGEDKLKATAKIDMDRLGAGSSKMLPKLIRLMFPGVHVMIADGRLVAADGKAHFELGEALWDGSTIPKPLVERIISAVGRRQTPPFDPLQPSEMPYEIRKADVISGYIIVYQ